METEHEAKFIPDKDELPPLGRGELIRQGYMPTDADRLAIIIHDDEAAIILNDTLHIPFPADKAQDILQLQQSNPDFALRVRLKGGNAFLTAKDTRTGSRPEIEDVIERGLALAALEYAQGRIIEKTRHKMGVGKFTWEVDVFHGDLDGLILCEIELPSMGTLFVPPVWAAVDVTHDRRYYNDELAKGGPVPPTTPEAYMRPYTDAMELARTGDVRTHYGQAVLYSVSYLESKVNRKRAYDLVDRFPGFLTLDHTPGGKALDAMRLFDKTRDKGGPLTLEQAYEPWFELSRRYIESASGPLHLFVEGAHEKSTFRRFEAAGVLANPRIQTVIMAGPTLTSARRVNKWDALRPLVTENHHWFSDAEESQTLKQSASRRHHLKPA